MSDSNEFMQNYLDAGIKLNKAIDERNDLLKVVETLQKENAKLREYLINSNCDSYIELTAGGDSLFHSENCKRCETLKELEGGE